MDLALETDGSFAVLRVTGRVPLGKTGTLSEYFRVARENGAVRCVLDLAGCEFLPTTIVAILSRESRAFAEAGGTLSLASVRTQNPFLVDAVAKGRFPHFRAVDEARAAERA